MERILEVHLMGDRPYFCPEMLEPVSGDSNNPIAFPVIPVCPVVQMLFPGLHPFLE